jgi:hypothetical protein
VKRNLNGTVTQTDQRLTDQRLTGQLEPSRKPPKPTTKPTTPKANNNLRPCIMTQIWKIIRNLFIMASPGLLLILGAGGTTLRLFQNKPDEPTENKYIFAIAGISIVFTLFAILKILLQSSTDVQKIFGKATCDKNFTTSIMPCFKHYNNILTSFLLLLINPAVLIAAIYAVNESTWESKDTIKEWLWVMTLISMFAYSIYGYASVTGYWIKNS